MTEWLALALDIDLPTTQDAWGFYALVLTTVGAGVGTAVKMWSDGRVRSATFEQTEKARSAEALATSQAARIDAAEKRELAERERCDKREEALRKQLEVAIGGLSQLTTVTNELVGVNKASLEEGRRANANVEALIRELQFGRRSGD